MTSSSATQSSPIKASIDSRLAKIPKNPITYPPVSSFKQQQNLLNVHISWRVPSHCQWPTDNNQMYRFTIFGDTLSMRHAYQITSLSKVGSFWGTFDSIFNWKLIFYSAKLCDHLKSCGITKSFQIWSKITIRSFHDQLQLIFANIFIQF